MPLPQASAPGPAPLADFTFTLARATPECPVLRMAGEVDEHSLARFQAGLDAGCEAVPRALVVNLAEVKYISCAGLEALARCRAALTEAGVKLVVVAPDGPVQTMLDLLGLRDLFPSAETEGAAVQLAMARASNEAPYASC